MRRAAARLLRPVPSTLAASAVALAIACGGATEQDVLGTSPSATSGTSTSSSGGTTSSSGASTSGATSTSGGTTTTDAGTSSGTVPGCPSETEPNDNERQANTLATSLCGTIANRNDVDFLEFDLANSAKSVKLTFEGPVTLKVTVNGGNGTTLKPGSNSGIPFVRGGHYVVEVIADTNATWRVNLTTQ